MESSQNPKKKAHGKPITMGSGKIQDKCTRSEQEVNRVKIRVGKNLVTSEP